MSLTSYRLLHPASNARKSLSEEVFFSKLYLEIAEEFFRTCLALFAAGAFLLTVVGV